MKFLDLELAPYGHFEALKLDFSDERRGFHLIYGRNEAGKSTTLRAIEGFLFGIPTKCSDAFLFDYSDLRIKARIQSTAVGTRSLIRRKGSKNTLLDADGQPVDEGLIDSALGNLTQGVFSVMYGLNHAALVEGAGNLRDGKGDLGETLFQAGTGVTSLHQHLTKLEDEAKRLFSSSTNNKTAVFNVARQAHASAESILKDSVVSPGNWSKLESENRKKREEAAQLSQRIQTLRAGKSRLERLQSLLPHYGKREALLREFEALVAVPDLDENAPVVRQQAQETLEKTRPLLENLKAKVSDLEGRIAEIVLSEALLGHAEAIEELYEQRGAIVKAAQDLPEVRREREAFEENARRVLREIGSTLTLDQVETIRLTAQQRHRINDLIDQNLKLVQKADVLQGEISAQEAKRSSLNGELARMPKSLDASALRIALAEAQQSVQIDQQIADLAEEVSRLATRTDLQLKQLPLWSGGLDDLEALPVPPLETIDRYDRLYRDLETRASTARHLLTQAEERLQTAERRIEEYLRDGEALTEETLESARRRRDGWRLVHEAWSRGDAADVRVSAYDAEHPLAEAFRVSIGSADSVGDRLRGNATRAAEYAALLREKQESEAALQRSQDVVATRRQECSEFDSEWALLWQPLSISPQPPAEMRVWLSRQADLRDSAARLREDRAREEALIRKRSEQIDWLGKALLRVEAPPPPSTPDLLSPAIRFAQNVLERIDEESRQRKSLIKDLSDIEDVLGRKKQDQADCEAVLSIWRGEWLQSAAGAGMDPSASPAQARGVLERLNELFQAMDKAASNLRREHGMQVDAEQFNADAAALLAVVAPELSEAPTLQAVSTLSSRLRQMREDKATRDGLQELLQQQQDALQNSEIEIQTAELRLNALLTRAGCESVAELLAVENSSERVRILRRDIATETGLLMEAVGSGSLDTLLAELGALDPDRVGPEIADLQAQIDEREASSKLLAEEIFALAAQLKAMDGKEAAADAALAAQEAVTRMGAAADQYIRVRLAALLLRRYIDDYRKKNQGPVLLAASEIFARLTLQNFTELQTDFNQRDESILLGIRASGVKVPIDGMSDGTRDALYLALRLASLQHHFLTHEPIPFTVDDILINLDDARAAATFEVLAELATKTQVLFFTHHDHLRQLAEKTIPPSLLAVHSID